MPLRSMEPDLEGQCAICNRPARQRCAACKEIFYCGREHQKLDWGKGHKSKCFQRTSSYQECEDPIIGRYLVSSRNLEAGELVLRESPLVEAPAQFSEPVCAICNDLLTSETAHPCERCGWPVCSRALCQSSLTKNDSPHTPECEVTTAAGQKINIAVFEQHHPCYQSLAPLRCLWLRDADPKRWKALLELQDHMEQCKTNPRYESDRTTVGHFLLNYMKLADRGFTEEDVLKICGILQVNGQEVPTSDPAHVLVCSTSSLLEHSCMPNCVRRFAVSPKTGRTVLEIKTLRAISRGEHLSISYSDPLWATANRRFQLQLTKFFYCTCVRCSDPRELGSMMSGIRCLSTTHQGSLCHGYMLPTKPLEPETTWRCELCAYETPKSQVEELLAKVGADLACLPHGDCDAAENFISRTAGLLLHPNHQYVTDVKLALVQMWGNRCGPAGLGEEPDHVVAAKLTICKELLALADIVAPGPTALRGLILMELQGSKSEEARRKLMCGELDPPGLRAQLMECRRYLVEAVDILKLEAASERDRVQATRASASLRELDTFLQALPKC